MKPEKISLADNIEVSVLREESRNSMCYAFLKIGLFGMNTYGISILGKGYAFESVGDNIAQASELFELVLLNTPSVEHLFDIVTDFRRGLEAENV